MGNGGKASAVDAAGAPEPDLAALLRCSQTGLLALDPAWRVVVINTAALELLALEQHEAGDPAQQALLPCAARPGTALTAAAAAQFDHWLHAGAAEEIYLSRVDGRMLSARAERGPAGHLLLALSIAQPGSAPALHRDPLTGLPDRGWFLQRLAEMAAAPGGVSLLVVDLNRFKLVNDTLGRPVGDALLQIVAKRLRNTLRDGDFACRVAGDEFAVAVRGTAHAEAVGQRVATALSRPYVIEGATARIEASVGIACGPEHASDPQALLRAAELALHAAKMSGHGATRMFDVLLDQASRERVALLEGLRQAVRRDELALYFQPQVSLQTGRLTGFEALVRWQHPTMGLLSPDRFLPLAEESGLIWTVSDWVLRAACEEAMAWPLHLSVSVNISPKQLRDPQRLPRTVKRVLLKTGLAPSRLELEITESALADEAAALPVLTAIRESGVRITLDDYGTGRSSLGQLSRFPLHKLKIDRSFIHELGSRREALDLVRAIASLGRSLGITTIAEGVETEEQQERVRHQGCTEMQGYLLSQPVPAPEVPRLIAQFDHTPPEAAFTE